MTVENPYGKDLGARDPLTALAETPGQINDVVAGWSEADFEGTYAPGKWSFRKVLIHLAQTELALTTRARFALSQDGYAAQAFSQDDWMVVDHGASARTALDAYLALRQFNLAMWRALTPDQLARPFTHPEYGELTVGWIMAQMAGHDIHHLKQFSGR
ncbi:MAG TPA: DinB family protein [Vicinamibacterales bacterium]|nr:DinB family protein [Vicinamibacterales bacterium]